MPIVMNSFEIITLIYMHIFKKKKKKKKKKIKAFF